MSLQFVKAGTADALVLNSISKQAFDSDVEVGAASPGGPPGYQSVSFHVRMARMNHLFKLIDEDGVILGGAPKNADRDAENAAEKSRRKEYDGLSIGKPDPSFCHRGGSGGSRPNLAFRSSSAF